jgi:hypothetical protein
MKHDQPFEGEILDVQRLASSRIAHAWLVGKGLVAVVSDLQLRISDREAKVVPGFRVLLDALTNLVTDATNALDSSVLGAELDEIEAELTETGGLGARTQSDFDRAGAQGLDQDVVVHLAGVFAAERVVRQLAQLSLGVTSFAPGTDDVYRVERAAVEVLAPDAEPGIPLVDDGVQLFATDRDGLAIEIAGIVCRLLIDWGGAVVLRTASDQTLALTVDGDELTIVAEGLDATRDRLEAGWKAIASEQMAKRWPSPVTVSEPATEAVEILCDDFGVDRVERISAEIPTT